MPVRRIVGAGFTSGGIAAIFGLAILDAFVGRAAPAQHAAGAVVIAGEGRELVEGAIRRADRAVLMAAIGPFRRHDVEMAMVLAIPSAVLRPVIGAGFLGNVLTIPGADQAIVIDVRVRALGRPGKRRGNPAADALAAKRHRRLVGLAGIALLMTHGRAGRARVSADGGRRRSDGRHARFDRERASEQGGVKTRHGFHPPLAVLAGVGRPLRQTPGFSSAWMRAISAPC